MPLRPVTRAMQFRSKVPQPVADQVLAANMHTCCICREARKHVQLHHIDGNPANNDPVNIAVLCLDCHSRVTGDEGLGRRFSPQEVSEYKRKWEALCADANGDDDDDEPEEPLQVLRRSALVRGGEHRIYEFDLERDDELIASVSADGYVDASLCGQADCGRWLKTGELREYDGEEEARECELSLVAPRAGTYVLLVINEGDVDVEVTIDAAVWEGDGEE